MSGHDHHWGTEVQNELRPLATELAAEFEKYSGACAVGTGEQFSAVTPTFPEFEVVHDDLPPHQVPADGRGTHAQIRVREERLEWCE